MSYLPLHQRYSQERKKELAQAYSQVKAREVAAAEKQKDWKHRETELEEELAIIRAQLSQVQSVAARTNKEQLSAVVMESQAVSVVFAKKLSIVVAVM